MRRIFSLVIPRIPLNFIRIYLYKVALGYKIGERVKIKGSIINFKTVEIGNDVTILSGNVLIGSRLKIGPHSSILEKNRIVGTSYFEMGENSRIINEHLIDTTNPVVIGNNSWLAGKSSQIWTHGSLSTKLGKDLSVRVGNNVYISSDVNIAPGTKIPDNTLVGLGSVVHGAFDVENTVIAGNPGKIVKKNVDWRKDW